MTRRRRRELFSRPGDRAKFGEDILASAEADSERERMVASKVIVYIILAIVGTGFGSLGLLRLFSAH